MQITENIAISRSWSYFSETSRLCCTAAVEFFNVGFVRNNRVCSPSCNCEIQ